jgi:hypothetical protein
MTGRIPVRNEAENSVKTDLGLFDNYPLGTLLAVAWEGGGATGTLASISKGIVTLGGPGLIILGSTPIGILAGSFITIKLDEIVAVAPITTA